MLVRERVRRIAAGSARMAMADVSKRGIGTKTSVGDQARAPLRGAASDKSRKVHRRKARSFSGKDAALAVIGLGILSLSAMPVLAPSPYRSTAPIRLASEPDFSGTPIVAAAAEAPDEVQFEGPGASVTEIDPEPLGSLGEVRGTVSDAVPSAGGMKVIEIQRDGRVRDPGPITISDPSDMRLPRAMAHLPDRALLDEDRLPVVSNGRRPMDVYAGRWSGRRGNRIAIVVGGLGLSQSGTKAAIDALPASVTLGMSPDGNSLERWMKTARRDGHELVLQIPMQPFGAQTSLDTRDRQLLVSADATENTSRLRRSLARLTNYVGVMNYQGGAFQADPSSLQPVMEELRDRGLLYLDDGSNGQSRAGTVARNIGAPFANADFVLDLDRNEDAIAKELARLEETARGTGRAIAVATAYPETVKAIADWAKGVSSRGFELVPVSALADDPGR